MLPDLEYTRALITKRDGVLTTAQEQEIERYHSNPSESAKSLTVRVQAYIKSVGILCLSELSNHPKLWRIYASDGIGVCLGLETLKISFAKHYQDRPPMEVSYSDEPKRPWDPRGDQAFQIAQTEDHLLRKAEYWRYQREWRIFMHNDAKRTVGHHPMPHGSLPLIILGWRLSARQCRTIIEWTKMGPFRPQFIQLRSRPNAGLNTSALHP